MIKSRPSTVSASAVQCHLSCLSPMQQSARYHLVRAVTARFAADRGSRSRPAVVRARRRRMGEHERDLFIALIAHLSVATTIYPRRPHDHLNADHRRPRRRATSRRYRTPEPATIWSAVSFARHSSSALSGADAGRLHGPWMRSPPSCSCFVLIRPPPERRRPSPVSRKGPLNWRFVGGGGGGS